MREIMIGVDSSDAAAHATRRAGQLAKETGATLTVVHVHFLPSLGTPQVLALEGLQARWKEADQLITERTAGSVSNRLVHHADRPVLVVR
jgi:nucleotide-binding universal stress UspA family protein